MGIARNALLWASRQAWLGEQFKRREFAKRATKRFIPGESVEDALAVAADLTGDGRTSLVSQLGENVATPDDATQVRDHYLGVLDRIAALSLPCQISLKPTQLGLDIDFDFCAENLSVLAGRAKESGSFIWVDMESSEYVDKTLNLFEGARERHGVVGLCVQSYLHRTAADLERLVESDSAVRIVKGAYNEPPEAAKTSKREVDESFQKLSTNMLDAASRGKNCLLVLGTHDMQLINAILSDADSKGVSKDRIEIQMLYGIAREAQQQLVKSGHNVRILISYGEAWFPWYMRRLAERPANVWFVLRSVFRG